MWQELIWGAPVSYDNLLAVLTWKNEKAPTVDTVTSQLQEYKESISSSLVSAVEKLSQEAQQLKKDRSYSPPVQASIAAIRSLHSSAQERGYSGYTLQGTLWFYLCEHREDMSKWDEKPALTPEALVHELQGKTNMTGCSSMKFFAPVGSSADREKLILLLILIKGFLIPINMK